MSVALDELCENMRVYSHYKTEYNIEWHSSGDMAWMKTERGLNGCNSKYPCFQCLIPKSDFHKKK